jgi:hypothetical protein
MEGGGDSRWWRSLGQKNSTTKEISYTEGIAKWQGEMAASRRRVVAVSHLGIGEKLRGGGGFWLANRFYSRRRERGEWRARTSTTRRRRQTGAAAPLVCGAVPYSYSVCVWRGLCLNTDPGHCGTGMGPILYSVDFLLFNLAQICKLPNWHFLSSKILQTFRECRWTHYEQLSFWK